MLRGPTPVPATSTVSLAGVQADDDQLSEVLRDRVAGLHQLDAALLGHVRAVDQVDGLLGVAGEDPHQRGDAEDASVLVREPAAELDLDPVGRSLAERLREPPELLAEGDEGSELLHHLGADGGDVDRGGDDASGERGGHLLGCDHPGPVLRLGGRRAQVRRDDDVLAFQDRMAPEGLLREDVEGGARDLA